MTAIGSIAAAGDVVISSPANASPHMHGLRSAVVVTASSLAPGACSAADHSLGQERCRIPFPFKLLIFRASRSPVAPGFSGAGARARAAAPEPPRASVCVTIVPGSTSLEEERR